LQWCDHKLMDIRRLAIGNRLGQLESSRYRGGGIGRGREKGAPITDGRGGPKAGGGGKLMVARPSAYGAARRQA
jgi:hypothetical protein